MGDRATLLDAAVYLIPIAVFLTLVALLLSRRKHQKDKAPVAQPVSPPAVSSEPLGAIAQPIADVGPTDVTLPDVAQDASSQTTFESAEEILARIEAASSAGQKTLLAGLYLELAAAHGREGETAAYMSALRSAAGNGALHGPPAVHAAARLALGEAAHRAGDLTSACEQWQIARTAFLDGGDEAQHALVEKRMRDNGCPTDWVLTDF